MPTEYVAVLRCQTWNVWPERKIVEYRNFAVDYGEEKLPARLAVLSYAQRTSAGKFLNEEARFGPLLWDGKTDGLHRVSSTVLKAPEDKVEVAFRHRNAHRGEVDICINFIFDGDVPLSLLEALRSTASALMSLLNLNLQDYLVPSAPFQVRKVLADGVGQFESTILLAVRSRHELASDTLSQTLTNVANALLDSPYGEKLRTALELYAAHFTERQARVRFLLLVMAIETLAQPTTKHRVATDRLARWRQELSAEINKFPPDSEEALSLGALLRELDFRSTDSIRSQVRKLFGSLAGISRIEAVELQRRALSVYDSRSKLVHEGFLPIEKLSIAEAEAKSLLERVFQAATEHPRVAEADARSGV